jgi:poly-gamma-glutamate synthesis protein (capsule biosynthesis protein)
MNSQHTKLIVLFLIILGVFAVSFFAPQLLPGRKYTFESGKPLVSTTTISTPPTTTLFFGGDIMLSRNVAAKMYAASDFKLPFENIQDKISGADIAFANLESPFNEHGNHSTSGSLIFNADPKAIEGLNFAGFDILSTANNHAFDQGKKGIDYTISWLGTHDILPVGTGSDCHAGQIIVKNNIRFGFLGYSYTAQNDGGKTKDPLVCDTNNLVQITKDIGLMRPKVDYLVVSAHMGIEYTRTPTNSGVAFGHNAIGNHPHWIQSIEEYKNKWIFYAMGNLVFDQMWSQDTREGLTAQITFKDKTLEKIELNPVIIDNFCCPRWASEEETKTILKKINPVTNTAIIVQNGKVSDSWLAATTTVQK